MNFVIFDGMSSPLSYVHDFTLVLCFPYFSVSTVLVMLNMQNLSRVKIEL